MRPWLISASTVLVDQLSKHLITRLFLLGESVPIISPILHLTVVQNTGAAFGLFKGQHLLFIGLSVVVVWWIGRELLLKRKQASAVMWGEALILGGAVGNLVDRVRLGYVTDFIDLRVWPVFNVADSAITVGVVLLMWQLFTSPRKRARA